LHTGAGWPEHTAPNLFPWPDVPFKEKLKSLNRELKLTTVLKMKLKGTIRISTQLKQETSVFHDFNSFRMAKYGEGRKGGREDEEE